MAVPANTITIRDIFNEINGTSHGANAQIGSGVTMSSLNAASNAYTSGTANHTGVNTTNNVEATPDTIAEWASYVHATSMGVINYRVRIATAISSWGLNVNSTHDTQDDTANADSGLVIWRTHDGSNTYIKAKALFPGGTPETEKQWYDTYNATALTLTTASSGQTLITIPVSDVTISATVTALEGTIVTKSHGTISGSGAALLVAKGAEAAEADPGSDEEFETRFKVELTASKSGYTTTVLNNGTANAGIICHSNNFASAETGE
jgi:hypothetical protein